MQTSRLPGTLIALLGFLLVSVTAVPVSANSPGAGLLVGANAPQFSVRDLSGTAWDLDGMAKKNKAIVINFWGLRCGACLEEMPFLDDIFLRYKDAGVTILGVNVDGVNAEIIKAQLPRVLDMPGYIIVPDEELMVADLYKLTAAPLTVVVDSAGKIVYIHEGYKPGDEKELESRVKQLIRNQ